MSRGIDQSEWIRALEKAIAESRTPDEGMTMEEIAEAMGYLDTKAPGRRVRKLVRSGQWVVGKAPRMAVHGGMMNVYVYRPKDLPKTKKVAAKKRTKRYRWNRGERSQNE